MKNFRRTIIFVDIFLFLHRRRSESVDLKVKKKKFRKFLKLKKFQLNIYLTWRKFCFEFRNRISPFFSSFFQQIGSELARLWKLLISRSIEFSHVTIRDERDEGRRWSVTIRHFSISHLFERVHLFVVSTVAIRSVRRDNNWIHLEKLSRAEERRGGGRREGAFVACIEKIASWNTLRTCNVYWRARNIAIFFSPNILQSFYFLISVKLIVIEKGRFLTNNEKISQIFPSTKVIRLSL